MLNVEQNQDLDWQKLKQIDKNAGLNLKYNEIHDEGNRAVDTVYFLVIKCDSIHICMVICISDANI